jgi:cobalt-zinc-cadmium resistance protein CzcA
LALLAAFLGMVLTGTPANLISLGAVDFGIIVDSTVIVVESAHHHLRHGHGPPVERIRAAVAEVAGPMLSSTLILVVAFLPLFLLTGVAGVIFSPLARTYAFSIGGAVVLALTLTPVLASLLLRREPRPEAHPPHPPAHGSLPSDSPAMRRLRRLYAPLFSLALARPWAAVALAAAPLALAIALGPLLGGEFMPKLEEGNFWIRATLPLSVSLEQSSRYVDRMRRILLGCPVGPSAGCERRSRPEVRTVISQLGRPDDGTDASGFYNLELFAPLAPREEWRPGVTKESLTEELSRELEADFPGFSFNFSQYIADNVEEALSGVKGENTVKVVGPDLRVNEQKAREIVATLARVPGIADLGMYESLGQPDVRVTPDRELCRRHGLNVGDVGAVLQAAVGGAVATQIYQGEMRFDLVVRWKQQFRKDLRQLRELLVPTPDGAQVPLGQLAQVEIVEGPSRIWREDGSRFAPVKFSVRGADLSTTIRAAERAVDEAVQRPADTHLEWAGEMDELRTARSRLSLVVPLTLLVIGFLTWSAVRTLRATLVALAGVPIACAGGVLMLLATGTPLSISAAMGFVSIFGIAVQDSLLVVTWAQRLWLQGASLEDGARGAAERYLGPVLMTTTVALIGLLPAALSRGIGSETQRPLALVVIGGALALLVLPRLLQPALLVLAHRGKELGRAGGEPEEAPAAAPDAHGLAREAP